MFLWAGSKGTPESETIYQKIWEYDTLDKKKTVTALKAGEDRAILLGLTMILFSIMMYFITGITVVRSYLDRQASDKYVCNLSSTKKYTIKE
uniref:Potassium calcium-activated channel subfamily M regulatory beta subunit 2 n=1 Tax=Scleropages formosus TaxID=113540 RepID=A0A8C9R4S6_SCLFO